jgi:hypothetical protein
MPSSLGTAWHYSIGSLFLLTALLLPPVAEPQKRPVWIAFSSTSTVMASDIRNAFAKTCPNLRLSSNPLRSDYALEELLDLRALLRHRHQWAGLRVKIQNALQTIAALANAGEKLRTCGSDQTGYAGFVAGLKRKRASTAPVSDLRRRR